MSKFWSLVGLVWFGMVWIALNSTQSMTDKGRYRAARAAKKPVELGVVWIFFVFSGKSSTKTQIFYGQADRKGRVWGFSFESSWFRNFSIFLIVSDSVSKKFGIEKSIRSGITKMTDKLFRKCPLQTALHKMPFQ